MCFAYTGGGGVAARRADARHDSQQWRGRMATERDSAKRILHNSHGSVLASCFTDAGLVCAARRRYV